MTRSKALYRTRQHILDCWQDLYFAMNTLPDDAAFQQIRDRLAVVSAEFDTLKRELTTYASFAAAIESTQHPARSEDTP